MSHHLFEITESFDHFHYLGEVRFVSSQTRGMCPLSFSICVIFFSIWNFDLIQIAQMEFFPKVVCVFREGVTIEVTFTSLLTPLNHWIPPAAWGHRERNLGLSWLIIVMTGDICEVFSRFRFESYYLEKWSILEALLKRMTSCQPTMVSLFIALSLETIPKMISETSVSGRWESRGHF